LEKLLPEGDLADYWNYNKNALMYYLEQVMYGINGTITDEFGAPLVASVEITGHDNNNSQVYSEAEFGDYYRPIYAGTYDVKFSADGYDDMIIENVVVTQDNATRLDVQFGSESQQFTLDSGWDLISLAVHPDDMSPASIFSPILADLIQVKDREESYDPNVPEYLNTLEELTDGYAYWIEMENPAALSISGLTVDTNANPIQLQSGWNLIGYTNLQSDQVENALTDIETYLVQIKSLTESYDPDLPEFLNTLTSLQPNKGYWIEVSDNCNLTYPAATKSNEENFKNDFIWQPVIYPNNTSTLYAIVEFDNLSENDVIGAFAGDECRAVSSLVWEQDIAYATLVIQMSEYQEEVSFQLYRSSTEEILTSDVTILAEMGSSLGSYPDEMVTISFPTTAYDEEIIEVRPTLSNYPNPFNPSTTIQFSSELLEQNEQIRLEIYNLKGQKIRQFNLENSKINEVVWDGKNEQNEAVSSGIYFYQLTTEKYQIREKMLLLK